MAEKIAFENGRISNFEGLVTLALTLDRVITHRPLPATYMPNFVEIEKLFVDGRTDGRTDVRTDVRIPGSTFV